MAIRGGYIPYHKRLLSLRKRNLHSGYPVVAATFARKEESNSSNFLSGWEVDLSSVALGSFVLFTIDNIPKYWLKITFLMALPGLLLTKLVQIKCSFALEEVTKTNQLVLVAGDYWELTV